MKRLLILPVIAIACLLLGSCHKTCTCYGYDAIEYNFTPDEVDSLASNCSNMVFRNGIQYYSYCFWQ